MPADNAGLDPGQVPGPHASWPEVFEFAYAFDGYEVFGGSEPLAEVANGWKERWLADRSLPTSLRELRGCLFFEQRRFHHFGEIPTGADARYLRALLRAIRSAAEQTVPEVGDETGRSQSS